MNFFANGGNGGGCGMNTCDLVLLLLLANGGGLGTFGTSTMTSCDIVWLVLLLSCLGTCGK